MGGFASLIASLVATDVAAATRRLKYNAVLYGFAGLFLLTAYGLGIGALAIHLARDWSLPLALLGVAGVALLLALACYGAVTLVHRAEERRRREAALANSSRALMATAAISALPLLLRSRPLLLAAFAGGLGLLLTRGGGEGEAE